MSILRYKDKKGVWHEIVTVKGDTGDRGKPFGFDYVVDTLPLTAEEHEFALIRNTGDLYEYIEDNWVLVTHMKGDTGDGYKSARIDGENLKLTEVINGVSTEKNIGKVVPQRSVDYWTPEDISVVESYVDDKVKECVGKEYEVMDSEAYEALTEYEVDKVYMVRI